MSPLLVVLYVWIGGMPIAGIITLNALRAEPTEEQRRNPIDRVVRAHPEVYAVLTALVWPLPFFSGLRGLLIGAKRALGFTWRMLREISSKESCGYEFHEIAVEGDIWRPIWRCDECRAIEGRPHLTDCSRARRPREILYRPCFDDGPLLFERVVYYEGPPGYPEVGFMFVEGTSEEEAQEVAERVVEKRGYIVAYPPEAAL